MTKETTGWGVSFGERLRWLRNKHGLTLSEFGDLVHLGRSYLSKLENGVNQATSEHVLQAICARFQTRREWLTQGEGEPFTSGISNESVRRGEPLQTPGLRTMSESEIVVVALQFIGSVFIVCPPSVHALAKLLTAQLREMLSEENPSALQKRIALMIAEELALQFEAMSKTGDSPSQPIAEFLSADLKTAQQLGHFFNQDSQGKRAKTDPTSQSKVKPSANK